MGLRIAGIIEALVSLIVGALMIHAGTTFDVPVGTALIILGVIVLILSLALRTGKPDKKQEAEKAPASAKESQTAPEPVQAVPHTQPMPKSVEASQQKAALSSSSAQAEAVQAPKEAPSLEQSAPRSEARPPHHEPETPPAEAQSPRHQASSSASTQALDIPSPSETVLTARWRYKAKDTQARADTVCRLIEAQINTPGNDDNLQRQMQRLAELNLLSQGYEARAEGLPPHFHIDAPMPAFSEEELNQRLEDLTAELSALQEEKNELVGLTPDVPDDVYHRAMEERIRYERLFAIEERLEQIEILHAGMQALKDASAHTKEAQ
ncbi:MAG: hypothetical protein OWS74_06805 [Firmicutes bacterium]|nr:hypothetical protein [Bacillota bacterium]